MGKGTPSRLDTKFRLVTRIICTYVVVRLMVKGVSIHENVQGGAGGMLARRKGKQGSVLDGLSPASAALIDELAQLPTKRKDYEAIFVPDSAVVQSGGMGLRLPAFIPAIASSSLGYVKTMMSSPPPASAPISPPSSTTGQTFKLSNTERRTASQHITGSERLSFQTHQSRWSMSSGSLDNAIGSLNEGVSEPSGVLSSDPGLFSTRRRYGTTTVGSATEQRLRLQHGTKNGSKDMDWAVGRIKDLRFTILDTAETLSELMDLFYEGDGYFS